MSQAAVDRKLAAGNARIGFSATGTFKRSDFGMAYGIPEPGTTMGVGDEIKLTIGAEFSGPALAEPNPQRGGVSRDYDQPLL